MKNVKSVIWNGISMSRHLKGYISVGWITYITHTDALFGISLQNALVITHVKTHTQLLITRLFPVFMNTFPKDLQILCLYNLI